MDEAFIDDFEVVRERFERLLYIPSENRTEENLLELMRLTSKFKIFEMFKMTNLHKEICRQIFIKTYSRGHTIFKQGDDGDGYYFVLRGCVDLFVYDVDEINGRTKLKFLTSVLPGNGFGELALIYDCPRTATAIPSSQSDIVVFKKKVYRSFVKDLHERRLMDMINFYMSIPIFKNEPISNIIRIGLKSNLVSINAYEPFIRHGSYMTDYYFLKEGNVKAFKQIKVSKYLLENAHKMSEQSFVYELKQIQHKQNKEATTSQNELFAVYDEVIDVMEFEKYEMIGEYYASRMFKTDVNFLSLLPCDLVHIKCDDLKKINPKLNDAILKYSIPVFEPDRIFSKLYKNLSWNNNKKVLLKQALSKN